MNRDRSVRRVAAARLAVIGTAVGASLGIAAMLGLPTAIAAADQPTGPPTPVPTSHRSTPKATPSGKGHATSTSSSRAPNLVTHAKSGTAHAKSSGS